MSSGGRTGAGDETAGGAVAASRESPLLLPGSAAPLPHGAGFSDARVQVRNTFIEVRDPGGSIGSGSRHRRVTSEPFGPSAATALSELSAAFAASPPSPQQQQSPHWRGTGSALSAAPAVGAAEAAEACACACADAAGCATGGSALSGGAVAGGSSDGGAPDVGPATSRCPPASPFLRSAPLTIAEEESLSPVPQRRGQQRSAPEPPPLQLDGDYVMFGGESGGASGSTAFPASAGNSADGALDGKERALPISRESRRDTGTASEAAGATLGGSVVHVRNTFLEVLEPSEADLQQPWRPPHLRHRRVTSAPMGPISLQRSELAPYALELSALEASTAGSSVGSGSVAGRRTGLPEGPAHVACGLPPRHRRTPSVPSITIDEGDGGSGSDPAPEGPAVEMAPTPTSVSAVAAAAVSATAPACFRSERETSELLRQSALGAVHQPQMLLSEAILRSQAPVGTGLLIASVQHALQARINLGAHGALAQQFAKSRTDWHFHALEALQLGPRACVPEGPAADAGALAKSADGKPTAGTESRQKQQTCKYFARGTCKYGADCRFAHSAATAPCRSEPRRSGRRQQPKEASSGSGAQQRGTQGPPGAGEQRVLAVGRVFEDEEGMPIGGKSGEQDDADAAEMDDVREERGVQGSDGTSKASCTLMWIDPRAFKDESEQLRQDLRALAPDAAIKAHRTTDRCLRLLRKKRVARERNPPTEIYLVAWTNAPTLVPYLAELRKAHRDPAPGVEASSKACQVVLLCARVFFDA
eukprot:TRINITY_DN12285_c0_g1_i2.p1 TRINITY_DN12285_c0_g1~~TRINITY_DN12285_c0_g1_i2.p1  ORF type:complete len:762 (+),score=148.78 TRINITY_DN12285_c0_g1_i2:104-2389(+)